MLHVVLYRPEIPPNTGNAMRLAANTGCRLHLVRPLGFDLDDTKLRRAGLDYREWADVVVHADLDACLAKVPTQRVIAFTSRAEDSHSDLAYRPDDVLLFGPESDGLPADVLGRDDLDHRVRIPMLPDRRSLNLANSVSIAVYEALRQLGYPGML